MTDLGTPVPAQATAADQAYEVFLRVVAASCLAAGLKYWALLIGLVGDGPWRFDLMPLHWKLASASLSVLFPVAATGLWMMVSWGPVVWVAAAGAEVVMYALYPTLFGFRPLILALHAAVAMVYVAFRLVLAMQRRQRQMAARSETNRAAGG